MSLVETPAAAVNTATVKWTGVALAFVGGAAALGAMFLGGPAAQLTVALALAVLVVLLGLIAWFPNAFVTVSQRGWNQPFANFAFLVPIAFLVVGGLNFHLLRLEGLELAAAAIGVLAVVAMIWAPRPEPTMTPISHILLTLAFAAGLGWGGLTLVNCLFDSAPGQDFQVSVQEKHQTFGRSTHYHLTLAPFGPVDRPVSVTVNYATYASTSEGGFVCTVLRPGALGFAWWRVGGC